MEPPMPSKCMRTAAIFLACGLGACGLTNPDIKEIWDSDYPGNPETAIKQPVSATMLIEFEIKKKIYCELKDAVRAANGIPTTTSASINGPQTLKYPGLIPPGWTTQVALSLQIDESSALTPGVTFNQTLANAVQTFGVGNTVTVPQSFNLAFGGTLSSTATRIDKFNPQYSIEFLSKPETRNSVCRAGNDPFEAIAPKSSPFLIESQLGIRDWLVNAMLVNDYLPSDLTTSETKRASSKKPAKPPPAAGGGGGGGSATKADTISYEIKFVIVSSGNITPTWKLLKVSANTSSPLFGLGRTRTHDLIVTIGPDNTTTSNSNLASQISSGVASANRALLSNN
jgi:hypothetical protein